MYKTILVHVDGAAQQESRLRAAALLANEHGAHLIGTTATGVSWRDYALLAGSIGGGMPAVDYQALCDAARRRLDDFVEQVRRLGVESYETRLSEDDSRYALPLEARYADLVVLSQDDDDDFLPRTRMRGLPEHVALRAARPVLVVPDNYRGQPLAGTVVVGWDGGMQAVRAIGAALPLLQQAQSVKLALVNPEQFSELHGQEPGADMALYLARHGVNVDVLVERTDAGAGEALLTLARDNGAGLLVTGAYGHGRYREWALGGVTRDLLEWATLPVLLAH